jgi:archaellum component FlaC
MSEIKIVRPADAGQDQGIQPKTRDVVQANSEELRRLEVQIKDLYQATEALTAELRMVKTDQKHLIEATEASTEAMRELTEHLKQESTGAIRELTEAVKAKL